MTYCSGIPGGPSIHKVESSEDLVGGICSDCEALLTSTRTWGSASPAQAKNSGKGEGIIINHKKHTPPPSKNFRNYPK